MKRERLRTVRFPAGPVAGSRPFGAACLAGLAVIVWGLILCPAALAQPDGDGPDEVEVARNAAKARREHGDRTRVRLKRERESKMRVWVEEQRALQEQADTLLKRHEVQSGDVFLEVVNEPAKPDEIVPAKRISHPFYPTPEEYPEDHRDGIIRHPKWTLRLEDIRVWKPTRVKIERPLGAREPYVVHDLVRQTDRTVFRDVFLAVPFALTNSTDRELLLGPTMSIVSENLRFTPEVGGFIAQQDIERTMFRGMNSLADLTGYMKKVKKLDGTEELEPVQVVQAGETRYGVGIFPLPDLELDRMKLIIDGLNNTYRFDRRQKRVVIVEFEHLGDEYYPYRESVDFGGKEWKWLWMWYEEFKVSPIDKFEIPTPTGTRTRSLWSYQVTLTNSSLEPQELKIRSFNTVVPMQVSVAGASIDVEVEFFDDGKSTIDKAKVMEELALPFQGDRFFAGSLEPDEVKVFPVIFDQEDIVWDAVFEQVERGLVDKEQGLSLGYGAEPLKPEMESWLPDKAELKGLLDKVERVRLTDEKKTKVREQVKAGLADAMERERKRFMLTANVTAECGISSGTYRVVRSYFRDGVIEPDWIHKWEE